MSKMKIRNSDAYLRLRRQIQESFNFAYIVCQAVPCLKLQKSLVEKGTLNSLPPPDYFKNPNEPTQISEQVKTYKSELAKSILLSSFSYFEAFVSDILEELVEFHGGIDSFLSGASKRTAKHLDAQNQNYGRQKASLAKRNNPHNERKREATRALQKQGFHFPSPDYS